MRVTLALVLCSLLAGSPAARADEGVELKKRLISATARAVELEIESGDYYVYVADVR